MMKKILLIPVAILLVISCQKKNNNSGQRNLGPEKLLADTITYDVLVKNIDTLDTWSDYNLRNFNSENFIEEVIGFIQAGEAQAYDFISEDKISVQKISELRKDSAFLDEKLGKLQFTEQWFWNDSTGLFTKEVLKIVFGYESFNQFGDFRGYKPMMAVEFKTD